MNESYWSLIGAVVATLALSWIGVLIAEALV